MWIHKLQPGHHEHRLAIPKILARELGWRPGAFILIELHDPRTLTLTLLGGTSAEAAESLAHRVRQDRPARRTTPRRDQP